MMKLYKSCVLMLFVLSNFVSAGLKEDYENSDFEFLRSEGSNLPNVPFSWLGFTDRPETTITSASGETERKFEQTSGSQFFAMPAWIGQKDMVLVGEYMSTTHFKPSDPTRSASDVASFGFGAAWLHQADKDWQYAAFAAPFGSSGFDDNSPWNWQVFAGAGAVYYGSKDWLWVFAGVADYSESATYLFPYVGFCWVMSKDWALNMILPWPSVSYAPTKNILLNFGAVPSLGSWRFGEGDELEASLGGIDVGMGVEYRLWSFGWVYTRVGMSGARSFSITTDGDTEGYKVDLESQPFVSAGIDLRMP